MLIYKERLSDIPDLGTDAIEHIGALRSIDEFAFSSGELTLSRRRAVLTIVDIVASYASGARKTRASRTSTELSMRDPTELHLLKKGGLCVALGPRAASSGSR